MVRSEQLRLVTSAWLGAVCCRVQIRLCTEQQVEEKLAWNLFPRLDPCLKLIVYIKYRPPRSVFNLPSLLLSFLLLVAVSYSDTFPNSLDCLVSESTRFSIPYKFHLHPLLSAEPDLNPATNGA